MLIPYEVATLQRNSLWANLIVGLLCVLIYLIYILGIWNHDSLEPFVLNGFSYWGIVGYSFIHFDLIHIVGNLVFLWVFGNAVCGNTSNSFYLLAFAVCAFAAAIVHVLLDGRPAVGASGAISGLIGVTIALYPRNPISVFWMAGPWSGTLQVRMLTMGLLWCVLDIIGAFVGTSRIAHWAHIGGFVSGVCLGFAALQFGWVQLTVHDNPSLLDILKQWRSKRLARATDMDPV